MPLTPADPSPGVLNVPGGAEPRTLVTGGAGFLGSHLSDRLIAEGHEVICLDSFLTGRVDNVRHLLDHPRFVLITYDVTKPIELPDLLVSPASSKFGTGHRFADPERLDYLLHLASPASPVDYARHPIHTLKLGSLGTYYTLGLAKKHHSVFLLASTSEVYGNPEVSPQPETYWGRVNPIGPRSVYDEAKRFAEAITIAYHREHGVPVRVARIFNTYGERMRTTDGRALPTFMMQAIQGAPLTVYGDGSQTRSFCYVSDTVEGLYRLLVSNESGPVNLGNPEEISMLELAREVIQITGSTSPIHFEPLPTDDPMQRRPDISKARTALGWEPQVGRRQGLERVVPYFRAQVGTAGAP